MREVISSLGLVTAVGHDVISAAAALRAGIVRVRPIAGPTVYDDGGEAPLMGSPVWPLTEGFIQTAAWLRLAQVAVEDVIRSGQLPPAEDAFWGETGLVWALPELGERRFGWPRPETATALQRSCGDLLRKLTGLPRGAVADEFILGGHAATALGLQRASQLLSERRCARVLLIAVDSWLDAISLQWLADDRRLHSEELPTGLRPGEAAACLLVEEETAAQRRSATVVARLAGVDVARPSTEIDPEDATRWRTGAVPEMAGHLDATVRSAVGRLKAGATFSGDLVVDLNGETWRASAWGHARVRLAPVLESIREVIPATSLGDVGAASGALGVCIAARSWARGYALTERALVCSTSDSGVVGTIALSAP
ncbi:hypothetical protein D7Y13_04275 [Corallococcus praedator]|uniref:Beta-ketoacyl synthase N-terminal domain-containing protein n=1 Tax=Corallococcus praedator TaxID=2316724 RepID=A0ABX9QP85_9BACT|nr:MULTISPECIES: hypothetical protein [Corallococcus]RKH21514.1 hypothetical protein D7X74_01075 [Corallococcus sp. CA047B]RKH35757.1 hypothetical protein D7X75_03115 [Corallococcus sp. CA031C]RKI15403.1 hypothetical protein D7Y13_04275 [Corallococcus praedator]